MESISIIIPVYNVEHYLARCLDSILPVTEGQDEVLLIQGDSNDGSREISKRYQRIHGSIRLLEQDGRGLSNGRNCGLRAANGDYILFIDSDDFVDSLVLRKLFQELRTGAWRVDVVMTDFYQHYENGTERYVKQIGERTLKGLEALPLVLTGRRCFWNVWRNLYRKAFLIENNLFFEENTHGEDIDYITRIFLASPEILFVNAHFYHYRMGRKGSLMNRTSLSRLSETLSVLEKSISKLRASDEPWSRRMIRGYQFEYILNLALIQELPPKERKKAAQMFDGYQQALLPAEDWLVRFLVHCTDLVGVSKISQALSLAKRIKRKREHRAE